MTFHTIATKQARLDTNIHSKHPRLALNRNTKKTTENYKRTENKVTDHSTIIEFPNTIEKQFLTIPIPQETTNPRTLYHTLAP